MHRSVLILGLLSAAVLLGGPAPAWAHKLNVFARVEGRTIQGEAYFRGQTPVAGAKVSVLDPGGASLGAATTDDQGKFTFTPQYRCAHKLVVDAGEGHGADYTVPADELPGNLPPRGPQTSAAEKGASSQPPAIATALASETASSATSPGISGGMIESVDSLRREIDGLRRELNAYQQEVRWHDVLGGIGYIVGFAGIAFYFLGAGRKERAGR